MNRKEESSMAPEDQAKLEWLRKAVKVGLDEIERGEGRTFESKRELDRRIDELAKAAK